MRATERYERAWNAFQIHLNHNPKASLIPFLKERHVNHRSGCQRKVILLG